MGRPRKEKAVEPVVKETKKDDFIVFGAPDISEADIQAVVAVLRSRWLSTGPVAIEFERAFADLIGVEPNQVVAVNSCTEALVLSLTVLCIGDGKEVITTPLTFAATANAILMAGAKPVFADVDSRGQLDPDQVEGRLTDKTWGIMPVYYTGAAPNMAQIMAIAEKRGIKVIEDAAHGFDGYFVAQDGLRKRIGTIGDMTCFSFYPTKNITAGEGGIIVARNPELAERIRIIAMNGLDHEAWRRYGKDPAINYEVVYRGRKSNLSDIHAALGLSQMKRWPELKKAREAVWEAYEDAFGLKEPGHSKHLFTIRHPKRDVLRQHLHQMGIGTGVHFRPLHLEPAYKFLGYKLGDFPKAERLGAETLSLPVSAGMTVEDAKRVISAVKGFGNG